MFWSSRLVQPLTDWTALGKSQNSHGSQFLHLTNGDDKPCPAPPHGVVRGISCRNVSENAMQMLPLIDMRSTVLFSSFCQQGSDSHLTPYSQPPAGNCSISAIFPFSDYSGVSRGQAGEGRASGDSGLPGFWYCRSPEWEPQWLTLRLHSAPRQAVIPPQFTESETTEGQIVPKWGTPEESISFMASALLIPQPCSQLLKPEHVCAKANYFPGIEAVLAIRTQIPQWWIYKMNFAFREASMMQTLVSCWFVGRTYFFID